MDDGKEGQEERISFDPLMEKIGMEVENWETILDECIKIFKDLEKDLENLPPSS